MWVPQPVLIIAHILTTQQTPCACVCASPALCMCLCCASGASYPASHLPELGPVWGQLLSITDNFWARCFGSQMPTQGQNTLRG